MYKLNVILILKERWYLTEPYTLFKIQDFNPILVENPQISKLKNMILKNYSKNLILKEGILKLKCF